MDFALAYFHLVILGVVSLFPPVNPLGTAVIMDPLLEKLNQSERWSASFKIAFYCFLICFGAIFVGAWILEIFGISLPVVRIAGGILICRMGLLLLTSEGGIKGVKGDKEASSPDARSNVENILFYPLAFPMTTGAGTISVILTLAARSYNKDPVTHWINLSALLVAILIMAVAIFLSYAYTHALLKRLGPRGTQIVNRMSAFLVFCVGIQIASEGILVLFKSQSN